MNDVERAAAIKSPQLGDVWQRSGHNWTLHSASHCLIQLSSRAMNAALDVLETRGQMTPRSDGGVQIDWPNAKIRFARDGSQDF